MQFHKGRVVLVLGGVRSGKSRYAQQLAEQHGGSVTVIATAQRRSGVEADAELNAKIDRHIADRPAHWTTVEEPVVPGLAISRVTTDVIVVDCLTLFAANLLELVDGLEHITDLCDVLARTSKQVILVSNEVGSGVVPEYLSGRKFRDLVGEINQRVAALADVVILMVAGLPMFLKGAL